MESIFFLFKWKHSNEREKTSLAEGNAECNAKNFFLKFHFSEISKVCDRDRKFRHKSFFFGRVSDSSS